MKKHFFSLTTFLLIVALHLNQTLPAQENSLLNTATGVEALKSNTTGTFNTATGYRALRDNTTGTRNTAHGTGTMQTNITSKSNTAIGTEALFYNTAGNYNTATGDRALFSNTSKYNTANGFQALYSNTTGESNTAIGAAALNNTTTGSFNTAIGYGAGIAFSHFNSTFVGANTNAYKDVKNSMALGNGATVNDDNQVHIGNMFITSISGQVDWTKFSDGRFKKNVNEGVPGLAFIRKLRPITYTLDVDGLENRLVSKRLPAKGGAKMITLLPPSPEEQKAKEELASLVYTGFVAQEVEQAAKELNYEFSGVDAPKSKEGFYGLRYGEFVVPLVKAMQELSRQSDEIIKENKELKAELRKLKKQVQALADASK